MSGQSSPRGADERPTDGETELSGNEQQVGVDSAGARAPAQHRTILPLATDDARNMGPVRGVHAGGRGQYDWLDSNQQRSDGPPHAAYLPIESPPVGSGDIGRDTIMRYEQSQLKCFEAQGAGRGQGNLHRYCATRWQTWPDDTLTEYVIRRDHSTVRFQAARRPVPLRLEEMIGDNAVKCPHGTLPKAGCITCNTACIHGIPHLVGCRECSTCCQCETPCVLGCASCGFQPVTMGCVDPVVLTREAAASMESHQRSFRTDQYQECRDGPQYYRIGSPLDSTTSPTVGYSPPQWVGVAAQVRAHMAQAVPERDPRSVCMSPNFVLPDRAQDPHAIRTTGTEAAAEVVASVWSGPGVGVAPPEVRRHSAAWQTVAPISYEMPDGWATSTPAVPGTDAGRPATSGGTGTAPGFSSMRMPESGTQRMPMPVTLDPQGIGVVDARLGGQQYLGTVAGTDVSLPRGGVTSVASAYVIDANMRADSSSPLIRDDVRGPEAQRVYITGTVLRGTPSPTQSSGHNSPVMGYTRGPANFELQNQGLFVAPMHPADQFVTETR